MQSLPHSSPEHAIKILLLESDELRVEVVPALGGKITSVYSRTCGYEFLWRNRALRLERLPSDSDYDSNFYGGIDELLPNDIPETVSGASLPDHGELWTLPLEWKTDEQCIRMWGELPIFGLRYEKTVRLPSKRNSIDISYRISNPGSVPKPFLWKLHAALNITAGDIIVCPAGEAEPVDLAWTRWGHTNPFPWPLVNGDRADIVPPPNGQVDFLYLYQLSRGLMAWQRPSAGLEFAYEFDRTVFPYCWLFASYGGFGGHYTAILEPCTAMPIALTEASKIGQCSVLAPGGELTTRVSLYAGRLRSPP